LLVLPHERRRIVPLGIANIPKAGSVKAISTRWTKPVVSLNAGEVLTAKPAHSGHRQIASDPSV